MIVVVEGISASGKTTWCASHGHGRTIAETGRMPKAPDRRTDSAGAAAFWSARNIDRWQAALALEQKLDWVLCDTDPLKLHYIWSLWKIGEAPERHWLSELDVTRQSVAEGRVGFADAYLVASIEPDAARERARGDRTRERRNFDLHVRLQPSLLAWYSAVDSVLPGRVHFGLPEQMPALSAAGACYDVGIFDAVIEALAS